MQWNGVMSIIACAGAGHCNDNIIIMYYEDGSCECECVRSVLICIYL